MTRNTTRARRRGSIAFGLSLLFVLVAAQTVGAAPPRGCCVRPVNDRKLEIDPGPPPQFVSIRDANLMPGTVEITVTVAYAYSVQLQMEGAITLVARESDGWRDTYRYRISGLTPTMIYDYRLIASGYIAGASYDAQIKG